jgi:hypothetical protein
MIWFFALLILVLAIATATALVRGLLAFHKDGELLKEGLGDLDLVRGMQQNRMMAQRVFFQGLAIVTIAVLGTLASGI